MILISHRGNTIGPDKEKENTELYIQKALDKGFYVEIDVWFINNMFYLGHDRPEYETSVNFLLNDKLIVHAKTPKTLDELLTYNIHCFYHTIEEVVLTSLNWQWTYPTGRLNKNSIIVVPEMYNIKFDNYKHIKGVCSDYVELLQ